MTDLVQKLITKIETLPELKQNMISNRILTELEQESLTPKSGCLDNVIDLVDQWLSEDSKYDEEVYLELEDFLSHNSVSIKTNLLNE